MAIVAACQEWWHYLKGAAFPITIYMDHKNLIYFTTTKELNRRQVRWWETLSPYDLNIVHRPGKENTRADALSRRSDYLKGMKPVSHAILEPKNDSNSLTINRQVNISATLTIKAGDLENQIKEGYKNDTMVQYILTKELILDHFAITPNGLIE